MFKGLNFTIVPFGVDIGKKRKKVLEDIIIKNEGKIIKLEKINNNLIPDFILTSKNVKNIFDIFNRKQIGSVPKEERTNFLNIIFKRIINYEWISKCVIQKKIIDVDDYIIDIEEIGIKKQSRNKISSQNLDKIEGIEQLKEELSMINYDKSLSQEITNTTHINNINSQNSNTLSYSSFNSNSFDLDNELNFDDISDEELFNKITNLVVNKNEKEEEINKLIKEDNIISESQEIKSSMDTSSNINTDIKKEGTSSVPKPFLKNKFIKKVNSNYFAFNMGKSELSKNKNKHLTDEFEKILEFHNNEGNKFEALA